MAFPLDIRTEINLGGVWTDISSDVYLRDTKRIMRGLRDQGSAADPSTLTLTLNNKGGKYSRRNAMSPLFGLLQQNTQLRLSVPGDGESYLQLDGADGNNVSTPDAATLDITGDLDVRAEIAPDWYGPSSQLVIGKWDRATTQMSWALQIAGEEIYFRFTTTGDELDSVRIFNQPLPQLPERAAIRATLDIDNGAGGNTVTFYWAVSLDGPWNQIGTPVSAAYGTDPIFSGSAPLCVGIADPRDGLPLPRHPLNGRGYRFEVRNGIDGTVVASPDFRAATPGATSLADAQGNTWTLNGAAEIRDREDRFVGEVSTWPLRWSTDDADVWTPVTAYGLMRRLGQGMKPVDSTLRRRIPSGNPIAYWPMEEQQDATRAYSPIAGVQPASVSSVEWGGWDTLPSSAPLPRLTGISSLAAQVPAATPGQWQVEFVYTADNAIPLTDVEFLKIYSTNGTIRRWEIYLRNARATVKAYDAANALVTERHIAVGADIFQGWVRFRFYGLDNGDGTFAWRIAWQDVGGETGAFTSTLAGTCGSVSNLSADWPALTAGWGIGHLSVLPEARSTLYDGSDDAYRGETAWQRMVRLAEEEGLSVTRTAGRLVPAAVGFQRRDTILGLFEAAADADGGLQTEDMRRIGLHYRDRSSMYAQDPLITLSYTAPGLGPGIDPVDDDSAVVNDVTVTRDGGSSGRAVQTVGPLSVGRVGKYDSAYTLSLSEDDQAEPLAYWRLHLGTFDGARYPTITLMLHKPGAEWLIPLVHKLREGDKIRLTNLPEWVSHDDVDLIALGWAEELDLYRWEVTLNCGPAGPWDTAVTDSVKAGTDSSTLAVDAGPADTSLYVSNGDGLPWTTDPAFMPIPLRISGEVLSASAVTSLADTFGRTVASGWGTSASGMVWSVAGVGPATDYAVNGTVGQHVHSTKNVFRWTLTPAQRADVDLTVLWTMDKAPVGDDQYVYLVARVADTSNFYFARTYVSTAGTMQLTIRKRVGGAETLLSSVYTMPGTFVAGDVYRMRLRVQGTTLSAKAWRPADSEPDDWQLTATDSSISAAGSVGFRSFVGPSSTVTLPVTFSVSSFDTHLQRFTVSRSVNGVVKALSAGESVNVANPAITSL